MQKTAINNACYRYRERRGGTAYNDIKVFLNIKQWGQRQQTNENGQDGSDNLRDFV